MNKLFFAVYGLLSVLLSCEACAQNNSAWDGFYGTVLAGKSYGQVNVPSGFWDNTPEPYPNITLSPKSESLTGWTASLGLGYNKAIDTNLIGLEIGGTWQSGKAQGLAENGFINPGCPAGCPDGTLDSEIKLHTYETLSARAGHIFNDTTLLYVSAGAALGQVQGTVIQSPTSTALGWFNNGSILTNNDNALGYVLGAGVEHKLNDSWSVRASYQYINFGTVSFKYQGPLDNPPFATSAYFNQSNSIFLSDISVGVAYKF